jgi:hypothetical protein
MLDFLTHKVGAVVFIVCAVASIDMPGNFVRRFVLELLDNLGRTF